MKSWIVVVAFGALLLRFNSITAVAGNPHDSVEVRVALFLAGWLGAFLSTGLVVLFCVGVWKIVTRSMRAFARGLKGEPIRGGR